MDQPTRTPKRDYTQVEGDSPESRRTRTRSYIFPQPPTVERNDRRRVNPEALATRLGPDICAALDALIIPGSGEMPSFSARKHIQNSFGVDRRHIYDYYHAKGLRVIRDGPQHSPSDIPAQNMDVTPTSRSVRGLPTRRASLRDSVSFSSAETSTPAPLSAPDTLDCTGRPRKVTEQPQSNSFSDLCLTSTPRAAACPDSSIRPNPLAKAFSPLQTRSSTYPGPIFAPNGTPRGPHPLLHYTTLRPHHRRMTSSAKEMNEEYFPPPVDLWDAFKSPDNSKLPTTPMIPLNDFELSRTEREEQYHLFSAIADPEAPHELQGSYRSYMDYQAREYYEPLSDVLDAAAPAPVSVHPAHVPGPSPNCELFKDRVPRDTRASDFRKWLIPGEPILSRESSVTLASDDGSKSSDSRGIAELILSRRSSASASTVSSDNTDSNDTVSLPDISPAMFGHVVRKPLPEKAVLLGPAIKQPPLPPPPTAPKPEDAAFISPTQELARTYLAASANPYQTPGPEGLHMPQPVQAAIHAPQLAAHPWSSQLVHEPYLPMAYHPHQHLAPPSTPAYATHWEHFTNDMQAMQMQHFNTPLFPVHGTHPQIGDLSGLPQQVQYLPHSFESFDKMDWTDGWDNVGAV